MEERRKNCTKRGLRNRVVLVPMVLNSEKLVLVCGRAVILRSERNVGAHVDNRPPTVMCSQADIHRYSVVDITKTSMTEGIWITVIHYRISLLLRVYYITYSLFWLRTYEFIHISGKFRGLQISRISRFFAFLENFILENFCPKVITKLAAKLCIHISSYTARIGSASSVNQPCLVHPDHYQKLCHAKE